MVEPLIIVTRVALGALVSVVLSCVCAAALAQDIPDPTRPPAAALQGVAAAQGGAVADVPLGPVLQSVLIGQGKAGRRVAVISGQTVQVGDKVGEATVVQIASGEVVLRSKGQRQVLRLYPDGVAQVNPSR